jgi:DNA-binding NarL/FixJ family response regulator
MHPRLPYLRVGSEKSMSPTRLFILYHHPLFARGLEWLLQGVPHVAILGSRAWGGGVEVLPEAAARAEVVILEKPRSTSQTHAAVTRLLECHRDARVLCLSLEDNQIMVYSAYCLTATEQSDLIRALGATAAEA